MVIPRYKQGSLLGGSLVAWAGFTVLKYSEVLWLCWHNRPVHALRGIMGNLSKIAKKQRGKMYVYLHISILRFIFERKLIL